MSERTRKPNSREDELNQARFFAERGAHALDVTEPDAEGGVRVSESIAEDKSLFREEPPGAHPHAATVEAEFGHGFAPADDTGILREARPLKPDEDLSLGR